MDIVLKEITKTYGTQKAVDNISFKVQTGEVLGFLGPNGAGKTTTMRAIACSLTPDSGTISVGGNTTHERPDIVKSRIGYLPEHNPLYTDMAIIDYLKFVAELHQIPKAKIQGRIAEMIEVCGLEAEKHKNINELSKGYRQRVGLAQALIHDPDVLILDEPTTGLDPNQIVEIRELIRKIGREKTVILSSHILAEVEATCDRIMIINKGKIVADGSSEELRKKAKGNEILHMRIGGGDKNDVYNALKTLETVEVVDLKNTDQTLYEVQSKADQKSSKAVFDMCVQNGWYIEELSPIETKLEDVFRQLTMN